MTSVDGGGGRRLPEAYVEELKRLAATHVARNVELAARISALVKEVAGSAGSAPAVTPAELLGKWLDFNLASYAALSTHSLALLDGLVDAAEKTLLPSTAAATATASPAAAPAAAQAERVELRLSGRRGERVVAPFLVENQYDRPLDVGFQATELVPGSGPALPAALLAFEPPTVTLAPRSDAVVHAAATITEEFAIGETYRTTIRLLGYQAREVGVTIAVLPTIEEEVPPPPPEVEAATPVARRRAPRQRRPPE